jgi:hypothetical protein
MIIRCAPCGAGTPSDSIENLFDSNQVGEEEEEEKDHTHTHTHNFAHATSTTTTQGGEGKSSCRLPACVRMISLFSCQNCDVIDYPPPPPTASKYVKKMAQLVP